MRTGSFTDPDGFSWPTAVLAPDVGGEFDSGGRIAAAPRGPQVASELVSVVLARSLFGADADFAVADVDGTPGIEVSVTRQVMVVIGLETDSALVHAIRAVGNPDELSHLNR